MKNSLPQVLRNNIPFLSRLTALPVLLGVLGWGVSVESQQASPPPWETPLPAGLEGLRLDHLHPDNKRMRLACTYGGASVEGTTGKFVTDFLVESDEIIFLAEINSMENANSVFSRNRFRKIYRTVFPTTDNTANNQSGWHQPEAETVASIRPGAGVTLLQLFNGKLFFAVDKGHGPLPDHFDKGVLDGGLYVADNRGVRSISLPRAFGDDVDERAQRSGTAFARYPPNDQHAVNNYCYMNTSRTSAVWQPVDPRVFVLPGPDSIFLARNRMTRDGHRMMDIVELDVETEKTGTVVEIRTDRSKSYAKKTGFPAMIDQNNILFYEYNNRKRSRAYHFRNNGKVTTSELLQDGYWHLDETRSFLYFLDSKKLNAYRQGKRETVPFSKVRAVDNTVADEIEITIDDFHPERFLESSLTFFNAPVPKKTDGKHGSSQYTLVQGHFFFLSLSTWQGEGNVIVKVPVNDPANQTKTRFDWALPNKRSRFHVGNRFVYYYCDDWIVRVSHVADKSRHR